MENPGRGRSPDKARERFEELFRVHALAVARYAARRTAPERIDDVVAETFLVAWRRLEDVPEAPLPWLLAVARRVIATQHRSARRGVALHEKLARDAPRAREGDLDAAVEGGRVTDALKSLHPLDREAIMLLAWDELTPAQAAAALGQTRVAFRLRVYRAKRRVRAELERRGAPVLRLAAASAHRRSEPEGDLE